MFAFHEMLNDIYNNINNEKNEKIILPKLEIEVSTTNTYFKNIKDILKSLNCNPEHFVKYFNRELGSVNWKTNSKKDGLVIIGKIKKNKIQLLLQQYLKKYVKCVVCGHLGTQIIKDKRMEFIKCNKCFATYNCN